MPAAWSGRTSRSWKESPTEVRAAAELPASASGRQKRVNGGFEVAPALKMLTPPFGGSGIRPRKPDPVPVTVRGSAAMLLLRRLYETGGGQLSMVGTVP